jgi:hypothetical protein
MQANGRMVVGKPTNHRRSHAMAAHRTTPTIPASHRRCIRTATATAGVAVLIAAGGYAATTSFGPDADALQLAPAAHDTATATDQALRELRESIARQYGPQPAAPTSVPLKQATRDYRNTVIKLYGPQPTRTDVGE